MIRAIEALAHIENTPEAVIGYVADVRHRPLFLPLLKSVSDIQGDPAAAGTTWKWIWLALGLEWEGVGRCLQVEPGRLYSFQTEGGIQSTWTYRAEPEGKGTKLSVRVEYEVPPKAVPLMPTEAVLANRRQTETEQAIKNLKEILDQ